MTEGSYPRNLAVVRLGGTFGTVSVRWEIHHLNGTFATQDFVNAYGTVFFLPGEVIKVILHFICICFIFFSFSRVHSCIKYQV